MQTAQSNFQSLNDDCFKIGCIKLNKYTRESRLFMREYVFLTHVMINSDINMFIYQIDYNQ